ncbi:MAG TPA: PrsW family intramembrane metalloprotease [Thermoplasmata archaeon]|nr:PrsW family intramembrane metalloprotease [Thermoplasmata archaeon]
MSDLTALEDLVILVLAALVPSLAFLSWVRTSERYGTEPWGALLNLFAYGALGATFVAAILEVVLVDLGTAASQRYPAPEFSFLNSHSTAGAFFVVLVIAPFVEEGLKASGVVRASDRLKALADGPVFGASVGLGFGFFETFLYGLGAFLVGGLVAGLELILVRSFSSVLLHGSSTAMFGYGYARSKLAGSSGAAGGYYLLAVAMHASFNALASLGALVQAAGYSTTLGGYADLLGLILAVVFALAAIDHVVSVVRRHDSAVPTPGLHRYRPPTLTPKPPRAGGTPGAPRR